MTPQMIKDTDVILSELSSKSLRICRIASRFEKQAKLRARRFEEAEASIKWIKKVIATAVSGRDIEWLEGRLEDLETEGFAEEELAAVPPYVVDHAIALCKKAIANQSPPNA
jgi:hypothetical protein